MPPPRWLSRLIKVLAFVFGVISIPIAYVMFAGDIPQGRSLALVLSVRIALYVGWLISIGTLLSLVASSGRGIGWLLGLPVAVAAVALTGVGRGSDIRSLGLTLIPVLVSLISSHFGAWLGSQLSAGSRRTRRLGFALALVALGVVVMLFIRPLPW